MTQVLEQLQETSKLTAIEQEAATVLNGWMDQMYDRTLNGEPLDGPYKMNIGLYGCCMVGDFRKAMGLDVSDYVIEYFEKWKLANSFEWKRIKVLEPNPNYCKQCKKSSIKFWNIANSKATKLEQLRYRYLRELKVFVNHMKVDHGWKPKNEV